MTNAADTQEESATNKSGVAPKMMSLSEFTKRMHRAPIKLAEADKVLEKYGLSVVMRFQQGRYETGLLDRDKAEKVIAERAKTTSRTFETPSDRVATLERIQDTQARIEKRLDEILRRLGPENT